VSARLYETVSDRYKLLASQIVMQFECGTRILRVIHGRDARATSPTARFSDAGDLEFAASQILKRDERFCKLRDRSL
jgi:hypothetical protein